jgi:hypothetical protein
MEHWFDRATKVLAAASVPRREVLRTAILAGIGGLVPKLLWGRNLTETEAAQLSGSVPSAVPKTSRALPAPFSKVVGPCHFQFDGPNTLLSYSAALTTGTVPVSLRTQSTIRSLAGASPTTPVLGTTNFLEITSGTQLVLRMDSSFGPVPLRSANSANGTVSFSYGPAVSGLQSAALSVINGTLSGSVNQRALIPVQASATLNESSIHFADGQPPPHVNLPANLQTDVQQLIAQAKTDLQACDKTAAVRLEDAPARHKIQLDQHQVEGVTQGVVATDPGRNTIVTGSADSDGPCSACGGSCADQWTICVVGAAAAGFFCPPCGAAALAGCATEAAGCWAACFIPFVGGCCKTPCAPFSCCDPGQTCCGSDFCCDAGQVCGGNICCPESLPVGCNNTCCTAGSTCCGTTCCGPGTVCVDPDREVCCTSSLTCGKSCCSTGQFCIDATHGLCCPNTTMINCGGECCSSAARCINNSTTCCDGGLICGNECCANGEVCSPTGHCGFGTPCGDVFCGVATPICCSGVCCAANQICVSGKCRTGPCPAGQLPCPATPGQCCPRNFTCCAGKLCCDPTKTECCGPRGCVPKGTCIQ